MSKVSCNVIRDLLPLDIDGAASEDSKRLVEEHLESCEDCRREKEKLEQAVPVATSDQLESGNVIKKLKKKLRRKNIFLISFFSILASILICSSLIYVWRSGIPASSENISVTMEMLETRYLGKDQPTWMLYFTNEEGTLIYGRKESIIANGDVTGYVIYLMEKPFSSGEEPYIYSVGCQVPSNWEEDPDQLFYVTIVYRDMRESYYLEDYEKWPALDDVVR